MSNFASLELCRELYELSGWTHTDYAWYSTSHRDSNDDWEKGESIVKNCHYHQATWQPSSINHSYGESRAPIYPAYDLGFLMRKLRPSEYNFTVYLQCGSNGCSIHWQNILSSAIELENIDFFNADIPENAAAQLCLELIHRGILPTKENK